MIPFEKISLISEKKNNKVWLASATDLDTIVVVKEITNASTEVFECIASIRNPHIPHILSMETTDNVTTIVEEYISGLPLNRYIKEKELSEREILHLFLQVCDGIKILHEQTPPIIHRDLKPGNLLVSSDGIVKIIDFDASRKYKETAETDTRYLGTAAFAPPEQYGYSQTDVRSDIYSLGAVMYEVLSGKQIPKLSSENTIDTKSLYNPEQKLSRKLLRIIEKCTMFDPSARYKNIEELLHALHAYLQNPKKPLFVYLFATGAFLTLAIGMAILFHQPDKHPKVALYTTTMQPAAVSNTISTQKPSATSMVTEAPISTEAVKKEKKKVKKKDTDSDKTVVADSEEKNAKADNETVTTKKKTSQNTDSKKKASDRKSTPASETPIPVDVSYAENKSKYYIDTFNTKTNKTEIFTYYYLKNNPKLTPINIACGLLNTYPLQKIYIEDISKGITTVIPSKYWSLKYDYIVNLSDSYLSSLKADKTYRIILDCGNALIHANLKPVNSLSKVTFPSNHYGVSPGYLEYSHKNPSSITLALANSYGRKITKIIDETTGKTIDKAYYTADYQKGYLTFKKSFFEDFSNGSSIILRIYNSQVKQISDDGYIEYCFVSSDTDSVPPQVISGKFNFYSDSPKDLAFEMKWNDGKGKLQGIYFVDSNLPALTKSDYTVTDTHIILKKEYFTALEKGTYKLCFEFGYVGLTNTLTVE